jgi:hypothetical protein
MGPPLGTVCTPHELPQVPDTTPRKYIPLATMSGDDIVSLRAAVEAGTQGVLGPLDHLQCGKMHCHSQIISSRRASQSSQVSQNISLLHSDRAHSSLD